MSYNAIIAKVKNVRPILGLDNLNMATVANHNIIISKEIQEGTLGVFFRDDGILNHKFCHENNLYRHTHLNRNPEAKGGFFEDLPRVKVLKLRGERSEGFWCPLEHLSYTGYNLNKLVEGYEFNELNNHKICKKYYTPATRKMMKEAGKGNRAKNKEKKLKLKDKYPDFKEHWDIKQLAYYIDKIPKGALLQISEKCHGCVFKDTIIDTLEKGKIKIKEIVENKLDVRIKTFNTITQEVEYIKPENYYLQKNNGEWYEIETETNEKIIITGNNPVWLPKQKCYRRVDELIGDEILLLDI